MQDITVDSVGRIDSLVAKSASLSRSFVNVLLDQGKVRLNGTVVYKPSTKVYDGDKVTLDYETTQLADIPEIDMPIVYKDEDCLVVDKPIGVLTHSKGAFNPEATVSTFIRPFTIGMEDNRGGIVHRLDRVTSGLLICARNEKALSWLQKQFADRKAKKTYLAVVQGIPKEPAAVIEMPIERNPKKPQTFRVGPNGKVAVTQYRVLDSNENYSLVELQPQTGRTHQLRVHLSELGHPILGDVLYGGEPSDRTYLHAHQLEIVLPNRTTQVFTSPVPTSFKDKIT